MASDNLISVEGETAARHSALGAARAVPRLGDRSAEGRAPQNTSMPSLSSCHSGGASVIGWAFAVVVALLGLGVTASGDGVVTVRGALVREGKHSTDGAHLVVDCGLGVLTEVVCDPRGMFSLEVQKHALCRVVTCLIDDREFAVLPSVFRIYDNAEMTLRVQEKNRVHATILDFDTGSPVRELKFYPALCHDIREVSDEYSTAGRRRDHVQGRRSRQAADGDGCGVENHDVRRGR